MSEESRTPAPKPQAHETQKDSVTQFLDVLRKLIPVDAARASLRATPHGVFVERTFLPQFFGYYQSWFRDTLGREAPSTEQKCLKKFFNTPNPPLYYLVEAKVCLLGHLIRREYPDPQRLGLPTYLGTVDDSRTMLHPRDPMLVYMTNLQVKQSRDGREFVLQMHKNRWAFSERVLQEFSRLLQRSPQLSKHYPEHSGSLRDGFRTLTGVLEKARLSPPSQRLLVPLEFRDRKDVSYSALGGLTFVVENKQKILVCYEVGGKTLFRFVKREFALLYARQDKKRQTSTEILPPRSRELAALGAKGRKFFLHPRAFGEFLRAVMRNPIEGSQMPLKYTVKDALEELNRSLQLAEPIEREKIARHLERIRTKHIRCFITSRWTIVCNKKDVIISCIDRQHHNGPSSHSRGYGRPRHGGRPGGPRGPRGPRR